MASRRPRPPISRFGVRVHRRSFLSGVASLSGAAALSVTGVSRALPNANGAGRPVLVFVVLRGGMDGLSALVPYHDKRYYELRKSIALSAPNRGAKASLRLDGQFGLHPALAPLLPMFRSKQLAFVHAIGSQAPTRSHFDAQDFLEMATPGQKRGPGFLTRLLAHRLGDGSPNAFALEEPMPRSLFGSEAIAVRSLNSLKLRGDTPGLSAVRGGFFDMYASASTDSVQRTGADTLSLIQRIEPLLQTDPKRELPKEPFARSLFDVSRLIRADMGSVFSVSVGGWDTHRAQGASQGALARRFDAFAAGLKRFREDLGPHLERVVLVAVTEFGRTARENGTAGTDHGHASVAMVLGGSVKGGKVYGRFPGLEEDALYEGRDLAVTTDYRVLLSEVARHHLDVAELPKDVLPDFDSDARLGVL